MLENTFPIRLENYFDKFGAPNAGKSKRTGTLLSMNETFPQSKTAISQL